LRYTFVSSYRTTAEDKLLQKQVQLSDKELDIIRRLERAENPDAGFDNYQPTIEWFTGKGNEMVMPLTNRPEPKSRFVPSKWEHKKVCRYASGFPQITLADRLGTFAFG
jgi:ribosome biogenesis protein ERB1